MPCEKENYYSKIESATTEESELQTGSGSCVAIWGRCSTGIPALGQCWTISSSPRLATAELLVDRLFIYYLHLRTFLKLFLEKEEEKGRERERETSLWQRSSCQLPSVCAPTGDRSCNPDMCPDHGSIPNCLVYGTALQPTEPHRPGLDGFF